jgi:hypothetical protein
VLATAVAWWANHEGTAAPQDESAAVD